MKIYVLAMMFLLPVSSFAYARESLWQIHTGDDGTVVATIAIDQTGSLGTIMTLLNVGFSVQRNCRAELGFAMLKGPAYGEAIGKQSPPSTHAISLTVDGALIITPAPTLVKYDNGWEAVSATDTTMMRALSLGTIATVRMLSGTPTFEFPISGAGAAIALAHRKCVAAQ